MSDYRTELELREARLNGDETAQRELDRREYVLAECKCAECQTRRES